MKIRWVVEQFKGHYHYWKGESGARKPSELRDAMEQLRVVFSESVLPLHGEVVWNYVRIEVWPSSGRLIAFPARHEVDRRVEVAACELGFSDLLRYFDEVTGSAATPEKMGRLVGNKVRVYGEILLSVWRAAAKLGGDDYSVEVKIFVSDDREPLIVDEISSSALNLV